MRCCVVWCRKTYKTDDNVSFHCFPKEETMRREWLNALHLPNREWHGSTRVCSLHFSPEDFIIGGNIKKLKKRAIPFVLVADACEKPNTNIKPPQKPVSSKIVHDNISTSTFDKDPCRFEPAGQMKPKNSLLLPGSNTDIDYKPSTPRKMSGFTCAVSTCYGSRGYSRHTFPNPKKNLALFTKWLALCKKDKLNKMDPSKIYPQVAVCGRHFTKDDFIRKNPLRPILNRNAYPSICIPNDDNLIIVPRPGRVDKSSEHSTSREEEGKPCNVELTEADIKIEIDETIIDAISTEYTLVDLYYDWEALNDDEKPKNWVPSWIDSGLLLAYFGDSLRHFSRSLLVCQDMTMEVRAEGKICGAPALTKITSIQDLKKTLNIITKLSICVGFESDTPCQYGLVISLNEQARCVSCAFKQKEKKVQLSMVSKFRSLNSNK